MNVTDFGSDNAMSVDEASENEIVGFGNSVALQELYVFAPMVRIGVLIYIEVSDLYY